MGGCAHREVAQAGRVDRGDAAGAAASPPAAAPALCQLPTRPAAVEAVAMRVLILASAFVIACLLAAGP
jgi:hypothetical protein